ncbi:hypothetical protein [Torque teno midi virus 14]|nr:hypothetical protein [Torque teno midi virus 14]BAF76132.1 hypothetical protein [Torque teno midi virus 14]
MQNISNKDFYTPTPYNEETKTQIWMSQIADSHDNICNCTFPFAHLLASIFPPGHQDRNLSINQILARDYTAKCLSGGDAAESHGMADSGTGGGFKPKEEETEEDLPGEEIDELLAAAAAEQDTKR